MNIKHVSKKWLKAHFDTDLDQMGFETVIERGWSKDEILQLEGKVNFWSRILGTSFKVQPFKKEFKVEGLKKKSITTTCSEGGVLYLHSFGPNYLFCADVFIAHEIGHYLEEKVGGFKNADEMRAFRNHYRSAGMVEEFLSDHSVFFPPFGIMTSLEDEGVKGILKRLDKRIGYNFRQINCDTIAFQKHEEAGLNLIQLTEQYFKYIEFAKKSFDKKVQSAHLFRLGIPDIARLAAGSWVVGIIAREIIQDTELEKRAYRLVGRDDTGRKSGIRSDEIIIGSFNELIQKDLAITNEEKKQIHTAFTIIVEEYMHHFIDSLGIRELFRRHARKDIHLERLQKAKVDDEIRINEVRLIGHMKDRRFTYALSELLEEENKDIQKAVLWGLGELGDPKVAVSVGEKLHSSDPKIRMEAATALGKLGDLTPEKSEQAVKKIMNGQADPKTLAEINLVKALLEVLEALYEKDEEVEVKRAAFLAIIDLKAKVSPQIALTIISNTLDQVRTLDILQLLLLEKLKSLGLRYPDIGFPLLEKELLKPLNEMVLIDTVKEFARHYPVRTIELVEKLISGSSGEDLSQKGNEHLSHERRTNGFFILGEIGINHPDKTLAVLSHYAKNPFNYNISGAENDASNKIGWAISEIGHFHIEKTINAILELLEEDKGYAIIAAAVAFHRLFETHPLEIFKELIKAKTSDSSSLRRGVFTAIGLIGEKYPDKAMEALEDIERQCMSGIGLTSCLGRIAGKYPDKMREFIERNRDVGNEFKTTVYLALGEMSKESPKEALKLIRKEIEILVESGDLMKDINGAQPLGTSLLYIAQNNPDMALGMIKKLAESEKFTDQLCALNGAVGLKKVKHPDAGKIIDIIRQKTDEKVDVDFFIKQMLQ